MRTARRDDAQVLERYVADRQLRLRHGGHADEAADLDHVGKHRVLRAAERLHALDGQQVRGDARDAGAHAVEHAAQLLDVGFACRVVDRGGALMASTAAMMMLAVPVTEASSRSM